MLLEHSCFNVVTSRVVYSQNKLVHVEDPYSLTPFVIMGVAREGPEVVGPSIRKAESFKQT